MLGRAITTDRPTNNPAVPARKPTTAGAIRTVSRVLALDDHKT
jgi:hypothetical protein